MKLKRFLSAALIAATTALPVHAQGVPTIDVTSLARLTDQLVEARNQLQEAVAQNLKLDEQTQQLLQQVMLLQQQLDALRNGLSLADLGFDPDSFLDSILPDFSDLNRSITAAKSGDWTSALASGSIGGSPVSSRVDRIFSSAGLSRTEVDELADSENPAAARIGTSANVNAFMSVAAESSSEAAAESLRRIDGFVQQIPDTANLKAAIDLNTRVTAELGIALANVWAMEAVQTVGLGEAGVMDAATAADEEKYLKVRLED